MHTIGKIPHLERIRWQSAAQHNFPRRSFAVYEQVIKEVEVSLLEVFARDLEQRTVVDEFGTGFHECWTLLLWHQTAV